MSDMSNINTNINGHAIPGATVSQDRLSSDRLSPALLSSLETAPSSLPSAAGRSWHGSSGFTKPPKASFTGSSTRMKTLPSVRHIESVESEQSKRYGKINDSSVIAAASEEGRPDYITSPNQRTGSQHRSSSGAEETGYARSAPFSGNVRSNACGSRGGCVQSYPRVGRHCLSGSWTARCQGFSNQE